MLLKFAQLLILLLPLPVAVFAYIIFERYGMGKSIAPFVAIFSGYAAAAYLLIFGNTGNWQLRIANWLRNTILTKLWSLLTIIFFLISLLAVETYFLMKAPILELRGQVLLDNRQYKKPASIYVIGHPDKIWQSDNNGFFHLRIPDERQNEFTLIAEAGNLLTGGILLTGKKTVKRGGHKGFEISLDKQIFRSPENKPSKNIAVLGKGTVDAKYPIRRHDQPSAQFKGKLSILTAAQGQQRAFELPRVRHGALTFYFLEAIREKGLRGMRDIWEYVLAEVDNSTSGRQSPELVEINTRNESLPMTNDTFISPYDVFSLVIGISDYEDASMVKPAFATRDAVAVYYWILDAGVPPANAHLLLDSLATKSHVKYYLERLIEKIGTESIVLIYYSGVGAVAEDFDGDELDGYDEYITSSDSYISNLIETAISDDQLNSTLRRLSDKEAKIFMILDTSYWIPETR